MIHRRPSKSLELHPLETSGDIENPSVQNGNEQTEKLKDTVGRLNLIKRLIPRVMHPNAEIVQRWNKAFIISCFLAIFVDPFFFFSLSVQLENKSIDFDWTFALTLNGFRTITDLVCLTHMVLQFRLEYTPSQKIAPKYPRKWFLMDLFVVLPLPQMMPIFISTSNVDVCSSANDVLILAVLFQCVLRLCRTIPMVAGRSRTGFAFERASANFMLNIISFMLAGHIVGSFWYLFGLQRVSNCLRDNSHAAACFSGEDFRHGIYLRAVNLTTEQSVGTRYVYSFFWGFQQLSTLGGNQIPSYYKSEVIFMTGIVALGLFLFALLIGNIQNFLQAFDKRRFKIMLRQRDLNHWMSHSGLPAELNQRVRETERCNWIATEGVDEDTLMASLTEDVQIEIRRHLFKIVKKIEIFSMMDEYALDLIYERLKKKTFIKGSQILIWGVPIKRMTFIKRGKMKSIENDGRIVELSDGNVCGDELLLWCLEDSLAHQANAPRPISKQRVSCLIDVQVFTLEASDLKEVNRLCGNFVQKAKWKKELIQNMAAKCIQVAWRNRKIRLTASAVAKRILVAWRNSKIRLTTSAVVPLEHPSD